MYLHISSSDLSSRNYHQLYNLEADLHITDKQYLIALTVFFFPYAFFEVSITVASRYLSSTSDDSEPHDSRPVT